MQKRSNRLFYWLVILSLGTLWTSVALINRQAEQQGMNEIRRETAALALLFATHTDTTFRTVDLSLRACYELPPAAKSITALGSMSVTNTRKCSAANT